MFAGPNGSGKTTVKNSLGKPGGWFGLYINPDDMEKAIRESGVLQTASFGMTISTDAIRGHFTASPFLRDQGMTLGCDRISVRDDAVDFSGLAFNSYHASVLADFLR